MKNKTIAPFVIIGAFAAFIGYQSLTKEPPKYNIKVFKNSYCSSNKSHECSKETVEKASNLAKSIDWGFSSDEECFDNYAYACYKEDGQWKLSSNYAAKITRRKGSSSVDFNGKASHSIILPVYGSTVHKGLYLPNGYPVVIGNNTTPSDISYNSFALKGAIPRPLSSEVCIDGSCKPFHDWLKENTYVSTELARFIFE